MANSVTKLHSSKLCEYAKLLHINKWNILYLQLRMGSEVTETNVRRWSVHPQVKTETDTLLDQFLGLEEAPQIEHLPGGQSQETTHAENAEVQHTAVCWLYKRIKTTNAIIYITWQNVVIYQLFSK